MIATELPVADKLLLSDIIGSLSYALDLTEGLPPGHCLRSCWVGMHVGQQYGMDQSALSHLYYTILLKDAGCSSNAARLFEIYETDDRTVKNDFKQVDTESLFQLGKFVMSHVGVGKSLHERVSKMLALVERGEEFAQELVSTRCERGADIARQLGFDEEVALGVRYLDEHWNGKGKPFGLVGEAIPANARIALLSQVIEVFYAADGMDFAVAEVNKRSGTWFDPALVEAFNIARQQDGFWHGFACDDLQDKVCQLEPHSKVIEIDEDRLDTIAEAFAKVVDAKSPYTYGHSSRVAAYTLAVAKRMGIRPARQKWLYRAALLHDIGKLGVSNGVLDKPGKLDEDEWAQVKAHAFYSEQILSRLNVFAELAQVAAAHHERLDGKGYPHGISADKITLETRIITVADIFDAITANRPYRGPIPVPDAIAIMEKERGTAIDSDCLDALIRALPDLALQGYVELPAGFTI
ncbi:HD-GYP domain-containing protein [Sulfuriferula nivalis]|uniref:Metal-dependent phosphohydrolase n=1 Tax=Sulfuriferula nivalis TaxID=2675298 RepID=A0A809RJW3_9PROT|nr:HD-GYP domain-containing protein [Sulfuriferula nivalis]BBP01775.1 metal-dependent phosphohydrolase [Sulfuriferula nivalis]